MSVGKIDCYRVFTEVSTATLPGNRVIDEEGTVKLRVPRYPDIASIRGAAGRLNKPLSWQEMEKIAHEDRLKAKYEGQQ